MTLTVQKCLMWSMSSMKQEEIHTRCPHANKNVCLNSFSHRAINNWNNLASEHVCTQSVTRQDYISHGYQSGSIHLISIEKLKL